MLITLGLAVASLRPAVLKGHPGIGLARIDGSGRHQVAVLHRKGRAVLRHADPQGGGQPGRQILSLNRSPHQQYGRITGLHQLRKSPPHRHRWCSRSSLGSSATRTLSAPYCPRTAALSLMLEPSRTTRQILAQGIRDAPSLADDFIGNLSEFSVSLLRNCPDSLCHLYLLLLSSLVSETVTVCGLDDLGLFVQQPGQFGRLLLRGLTLDDLARFPLGRRGQLHDLQLSGRPDRIPRRSTPDPPESSPRAAFSWPS